MNVAVAPLAVPLFSALVLLLWWRPTPARRLFAAGSTFFLTGLSYWLVWRCYSGSSFFLPVGNWTAPYGIHLIIDPLSSIMLALTCTVVLAAILYDFAELRSSEEHPLRQPLQQFLLMGLNLSFTTGDLFNLFVAFEIMLIASYALLTLEADDWEVKEAFPYVAINLVGSTFFLCGAAFAYSLFGTLNFGHIAMRSSEFAGDPRLVALGLLFVLVFGLKAGVFPLYFWLPNSYPTLPTPLMAIYGGLLTKVGIYVLLRVFGTALPPGIEAVQTVLLWMAGATMLIGVLGALSRRYARGILAFQVISAIGFMVVGIAFLTPRSVAAGIFYVAHDILVKASLFLIIGVAARLNQTDRLREMGQLWRRAPWLGFLFLLQAFSLAGIPPLSGFWGKLALVTAGVEARSYWIVAALIATSVLTLFSMLRIWNAAFWNDDTPVEPRLADRRWRPMAWVAAGLTALSLITGLGAEGVIRLSERAAEKLLDRDGYAQLMLEYEGKGTRTE